MKKFNIICSRLLNPINLLIMLIMVQTMVQTAFATQARIESMGKRPAFFLDDMTMFENPANATFYSSALMGELGFFNNDVYHNYNQVPCHTSSHRCGLGIEDIGRNQDPFTPWFGALFQFGLADNGLRDPEVTIGGFFGREHYNFTRFIPRKVILASGDTVSIPQSITNFDAFLAGTMIDGSAVGAHVYVGVQDGKQDNNDIAKEAHVSILSMDYGANFLITHRSSMEVTLGAARIQYGPSRKTFLDPGLFSFYSQGRLFLEMDLWHGQIVTGYKVADMEVPGWQERFYDLNVGLNAIIPRGMIWFGIDAVHVKEFVDTWDRVREDNNGKITDSYLVYREPGSKEIIKKDRTERIGAIASFGIERNVFSNLLILRAGAQKSFIYERCYNYTGRATICELPAGSKGNYWVTNPYGDGTLDDHIGFGIGLNIENKLKVDATLAEDILFRNPFNYGLKGLAEGRLISRISAIYSF